MKTYNVKLAQEEINFLVSTLDLATKNGGLQIASVCLSLAQKLNEAMNDNSKDPIASVTKSAELDGE